ncbi:MAG: thioredoxin family protein, partial [Mycobacteriales bacterium]
PGQGADVGPGVVALAVVLALTLALALAWRVRSGNLRAPEPAPDGAAPDADRLAPALLAELGVATGTDVTLLQFSTAFCAPCRATRTLLADIAAGRPEVRHLEVDAESHLDLVRTLGIRRTPTVLVLDPTGRVVRRGSGQPRRADVLAAVAAASSPAAPFPVDGVG